MKTTDNSGQGKTYFATWDSAGKYATTPKTDSNARRLLRDIVDTAKKNRQQGQTANFTLWTWTADGHATETLAKGMILTSGRCCYIVNTLKRPRK